MGECLDCKHQGKNRPFCHECWHDKEHPYFKRKPQPFKYGVNR